MKRLRYNKVNKSIFLISITVTIIFNFINFAVFSDRNSGVIFCAVISFVACLCFFYRLNLGIIAIIRGRFGKPSRKDYRFVDYDKVPVDNIEKLKKSVDYGKKSILLYKVNTREIYQFVKLDSKLFLNKCTLDDGLVTDFTNLSEINSGRGDNLIDYRTIKAVNFICSPANYYLPVINIVTNHKQYRFIGFLEALTPELIKSFCDDINVKVSIKSTPQSEKMLKVRNETDKCDFIYNLLILLAILFTPYTMYIHTYASGVRHNIAVLYAVISITVLMSFIFLTVFDAKHYKIGAIDDSSSEYIKKKRKKWKTKEIKRKDITAPLLLIPASIVFDTTFQETYINSLWYIILSVIFSLVCIVAFLKTNLVIPDTNKGKIVRIVLSCFIFIISGCAVVSTINNVVVKQEQSSYLIVDKRVSTSTKGGDRYYAAIRYQGDAYDILISADTYDSNDNMLEVRNVKGLLGIEYLIED